MLSVVEAFLLGWRSCRERGALAKVQNPDLSMVGVFSEMTPPSPEVVLEIIRAETKTEDEFLKEHPIG
jgi:hypothetical protein